MEQIDQTLIERYLANALTPAERSEVERRVQDDAQFRKDVAEYKLSIEAIRLSEREELKNRFRQRDKMLDKKNNNSSGGKRVSFWWLAVAAGISIMVAWYFLYAPDRSIDEAKNDTIDSSIIVQNPHLLIDTTKTNKPVSEETNEKKEKKERVKPKKPEEQIFAENFEAYKDESLDPTSRSGEDDLTPLEKFQLNYWEGNFKEARATFNSMSQAQKQNDNLRFLYANVLMSLDMTNEASLILTGVLQNHKSFYSSESRFYLGLCNLKSGKVDEARENLKAYLDDQGAQHKDRAKKILEELN